jgi:hypothetical protein
LSMRRLRTMPPSSSRAVRCERLRCKSTPTYNIAWASILSFVLGG